MQTKDSTTVRVQYDDQPNEAIDKANRALDAHGIRFELGKSGDGWLEYRLVATRSVAEIDLDAIRQEPNERSRWLSALQKIVDDDEDTGDRGFCRARIFELIRSGTPGEGPKK